VSVPEVTETEAAAIKTLIDAGATIKTDEGGSATDVSFLQQTAPNDIFDKLAELKSLRVLNLAESSFNDDCLPALDKVSLSLANLDLRGCSLSDKATSSIARFTGLRALRFSGKNGKTSIGDDGLKALTACKSLKVLALDDLWIGTAGIEALSPLKELEELYLAGTVVDDDAAKFIAAFPKLKKLRLARTQVSDTALETLSARTSLVELDLSENSLITNDGMVHLAKLTNLSKLNLWRVQISDEGALLLASLTKMDWLNLDNSKLGDAGLPLLKDMKALTFLHIGSTQVTEAGAPALFHLKTLKDLKLTRTAMGASDSAVADLQKHLPDTAIQTEYVEAE
jgi:Leucine-rich repeat (LRR) protein